MESYLKFIVILTVLAASICHVQSEEIEIEEDNRMGVFGLTAKLPNVISCPHYRFIVKHVCGNFVSCHDNHLSASMYAQQVANIRESGVAVGFNSVFIAPNINFNKNGDHCVFNRRVPKYNCQLNRKTRSWDCIRVGDVIATHSASNGNYLNRLDV